MAFDRWTVEYHLTPNGWVKGTKTYFDTTDGEIPRPADAIETWKQEGYQRSGWGAEEITHRCIWHAPSMSEDERKRLRSQFQSPFSSRSRKVDA